MNDLEYSRKYLEPVSLNLEPELVELLRVLAERHGLPMSVYVRQLAIKGLNQELTDFNSWRLFKNNLEGAQKL